MFFTFKVLRFRAQQSTQDVPFAVLSAFKHHLGNISKKGKVSATSLVLNSASLSPDA